MNREAQELEANKLLAGEMVDNFTGTCERCGNTSEKTRACSVCGKQVCDSCVDFDWMNCLDTSLLVCQDCYGKLP